MLIVVLLIISSAIFVGNYIREVVPSVDIRFAGVVVVLSIMALGSHLVSRFDKESE